MLSFGNVQDKFFNMDKEQIVILAGVTLCALSIGAFIFWGPNPRPRRRGAIVGLQNLGFTCFLNTLLQSLASCVLFMDWLESCRDQGRVASTLHYLLKVLSSERSKLPESVEDPLDPTELIVALLEHGWSFASGEQDAHELYHLLMTTLEEEAHKAIPVDGGLLDSLEPQPEEKMLPESPGDMSENSHVQSNHVLNQPSGDSMEQTPSHSSETPCLSEFRMVIKQEDVFTRKAMPKYDCNRNYQASPFCGLLTSQLQCVTCGFKSVLKYDKFDSLSLHMPEEERLRYTLTELLENFTRTEAVTGVACDGCNKGRDPDLPAVTATSLKSVSIGKLPKSLCFHVHRMSMGKNGDPYKRREYVLFPEFLVMDRYTQNSIIKEQKIKDEIQSADEDKEISMPSFTPREDGSWSHLYRLKAVVVHSGTVKSGHFVTYRRGPLNSSSRHRSDRWYFTSDEVVKETTLLEVCQAAAYMLFYERSAVSAT
ncbi:ubiquitin carboxyl-terminal hydrolase 30 homolog [Homalodisca vitripennis]|uniref:ubiquitin carboxyl-terminal hydrolase 30 homolog n=1 Tax=Homalodisca vitripennis TaxID=197043 RepID=UPI001EEAE880|nr:ubiquitin carboxyl-terminal hydrolase 30 homolog [Homalodisca vitripennis]